MLSNLTNNGSRITMDFTNPYRIDYNRMTHGICDGAPIKEQCRIIPVYRCSTVQWRLDSDQRHCLHKPQSWRAGFMATVGISLCISYLIYLKLYSRLPLVLTSGLQPLSLRPIACEGWDVGSQHHNSYSSLYYYYCYLNSISQPRHRLARRASILWPRL